MVSGDGFEASTTSLPIQTNTLEPKRRSTLYRTGSFRTNAQWSSFSKRALVESIRTHLHPRYLTAGTQNTEGLVQMIFWLRGLNPSEKYESKWVHLPQIGMNIKNLWNHHLEGWFWGEPSRFSGVVPPGFRMQSWKQHSLQMVHVILGVTRMTRQR